MTAEELETMAQGEEEKVRGAAPHARTISLLRGKGFTWAEVQEWLSGKGHSFSISQLQAALASGKGKKAPGKPRKAREKAPAGPGQPKVIEPDRGHIGEVGPQKAVFPGGMPEMDLPGERGDG